MADNRLRVKHLKEKWTGRLTAKLGMTYWSVQRDGHEFYRIVKEEDLEPVDDVR